MRTKIQQILDSIKTFEIELYPGHQTYIYLNPEDCSLYGARSDVTPDRVSRNIDRRILDVAENVNVDTVRQALAEYLLKIYELQDTFKGTEWNGHSHVGVWDSDYEQRRKDGYRPFWYMEECLSFFWAPEEWFDTRDSNDWQMKRKWELGLSVEEIIDTEDLGGAHCQGQ